MHLNSISYCFTTHRRIPDQQTNRHHLFPISFQGAFSVNGTDKGLGGKMPHIVCILFYSRKSRRNKIGKGLVGKANNPHCRRNTQALIMQGLHSSNSRKIAGTKHRINPGLLQEAKGTLIPGFRVMEFSITPVSIGSPASSRAYL